MDLRNYYKKVRDAEATLPEGYVVMVSLATSEGGKEGVRTEVSRYAAAKLIVEGRSRVATADKTNDFHELNREAKAKHEQDEAARRVQVMVLPAQEFRKTKERS
jgi:hypothetical protein